MTTCVRVDTTTMISGSEMASMTVSSRPREAVWVVLSQGKEAFFDEVEREELLRLIRGAASAV